MILMQNWLPKCWLMLDGDKGLKVPWHSIVEGTEDTEMLNLIYQICLQWGSESFKGNLLIIPMGLSAADKSWP